MELRGRVVQQVFDQFFIAGEHQIITDVSTLEKGVYVYKLNGDQVSLSKKMIVY